MADHISVTLKALQNLDLSSYPCDDIRKLIERLGRFGSVVVTLHPGKTIMRARPNNEGESFTSKCDLTYKPQRLNDAYQRASTRYRTMFYGSVIPENIQKGELDNPRVIGACEALSWLRDKSKKGYQKISFGRWIVNNEINLIGIVQDKDFYAESSYTRELVDGFNEFMKHYPELKDETLKITDYFAHEFSKEDTTNDFDYLISAILSEMIVDQGFDGIMYPSVRVKGKGFNVAIRPEIADANLDLVVAGECSIYKHYDHTIVDNDTITELSKNQTHFELQAVIDPQYHAGQEKCLQVLGLESMVELTG